MMNDSYIDEEEFSVLETRGTLRIGDICPFTLRLWYATKSTFYYYYLCAGHVCPQRSNEHACVLLDDRKVLLPRANLERNAFVELLPFEGATHAHAFGFVDTRFCCKYQGGECIGNFG